MKKLLSRIIGILLITAALLGWFACVAGLVSVYRGMPKLASALQRTFVSLDETLDSTAQLLTVTQSTLDSLEKQVTVIERASKDIAETLDTAVVIAGDFANLSGKELPGLVENLQTSLASMQSSANLVDDTLGLIGGIPFIGSRYTPDVPLSQTVASVSKDLDGLNPVFIRMKNNMQSTSGDLKSLKYDVEDLTGSLTGIKSSIAVVQKAASEYEIKVSSLRQRLTELRGELPGYLATATVVVTLVILWVAVLLIGAFTQGLELVSRRIDAPATVH